MKALISVSAYSKVVYSLQAFFGKWRTKGSSLLTEQSSLADLQNVTGSMRVEMGKEPGRVFEMCKKVLSVGRLPENDIFLEDVSISRLHASILNMGKGNYVLIDEGSVNGTEVNGQKMDKYQRCSLKEGDRIQIGGTVLIFSKQCAI